MATVATRNERRELAINNTTSYVKSLSTITGKEKMREHMHDFFRFVADPEVTKELWRQDEEIDYKAVLAIFFDVLGYQPPAEVIVGKAVDTR